MQLRESSRIRAKDSTGDSKFILLSTTGFQASGDIDCPVSLAIASSSAIGAFLPADG
jgi:hypothetical protein